MDMKKLLESIDSLSEAQMQVPTKGPDGRPIPGQPPVQIRTNFSGPDGSALNAAITTAARTGGMTAIIPDNRTETQAKAAALAAAKRASMAGESPSVKEEVIDEDDGDSDLGLLKRMAGLIEADDDAEVKPTAGGAGDLNAGNTASGVSTATPPTTPEPLTPPTTPEPLTPPTAPTPPTTPEAPKTPSQQDINRQGKTGAELMYTSGGQFMNKSDRLNQEKVDSVLGKNPDGTSKFKAGQGDTNLALAAYFKNQQSQPANTSNQTSNTSSQTANTSSTTPAASAPTTPEPATPAPPAPSAPPAPAEPAATASTDSQPQLNVGGINASDADAVAASREKLSDIGSQAANAEPETTATPAANAAKVSYREKGPRGSVFNRTRNISQDTFRRNQSRGDYGPIDFTVKSTDGKTRTIKQGDPEYVKYLDQYTNQLKEQSMISEKWAGKADIKQTGQYSGKTIEELKAMLDKINKSGPHEQDSAQDKRRKQIQFAIRAKKDWKGGVQEAELPNQGADYGAGLGAGRNDKVLEKAPPGREKQVKKLKGKVDNPYAVAWASYNKSHAKENANPDINNRHKVNESMNFKKLKAAYQEGYAHGLREMGSRFKHYEDMEEAKHYFEGYKCGLEECYGLQPNRGLVDETQSAQDVVDNMASFGAEEGALGEMDKGDWMKHKAQTTPGDTFKAFGQTFNDKEVLETELAFEALDKQLAALINENVEQKSVTEGISVSMSTGQQGSPDSVSVTATNAESAKLLDFIKQVGLGGLGGSEASVTTVAEPTVVSVSDYGGPKFSPHDAGDMSGMLSKLTALSSEDEHDHEHNHSSPCNECGMMEAKCECEKEEVEETQTVDQSEYMVAEDDGEGTIQAGAQEAEINASMPARGGAVTESVEVIQELEDYELEDGPAKVINLPGTTRNLDAGDPAQFVVNPDMKDMLGKLDGIQSSNTSSYEVDGKPASKADYDKAMSNFKMPDMPNMPELPSNAPAGTGAMLAGAYKSMMNRIAGMGMGSRPGREPASGGIGQSNDGEGMFTLPGGSKVNAADFDKFILPPVEVTGKKVGGEQMPGDLELGRLLNLSGANTYDELAAWMKNRGKMDDLQPVTINSKKRNTTTANAPVPPGEDELQPVKVTGKRVLVPGDSKLTPDEVDVSDLQAQLDAMMKDIMPGMNDRAERQLDFDQDQANKTRSAAGDWFRNKIGSAASLDNPRTREKLDRLRDMKEETTDKMDQDAEKAGKKVAKDIEHDEGHKGKDDNKAEKAGQKVTKDIEYDDKKDREEKLDEWANNAGGKGTDASFERDIEFMTKVIAGGLNKPKVTGQTTIPVIASQDARNGDEDVAAWKRLAGIQK